MQNNRSRPKSHRPQRVADQIREEIAQFLLNGVKNDRIGFVTITDVRVTPDLQLARVSYTALGSDKQKEESALGMEESKGKIRAHLSKVLKMRYTPRLEFFVDEGLENSYKIQNLLNSISTSNHSDEDPNQ